MSDNLTGTVRVTQDQIENIIEESDIQSVKKRITKKCSEVQWQESNIELFDFLYKQKQDLKPGMELWDLAHIQAQGHIVTGRVLCHRDTGVYCGTCGHMIVGGHWVWTCECGHMIDAEYKDLLVFDNAWP